MLLLDELERQVLADRQVVAIHNASGRYEERPLPTFHEARDRFDAALVEEPAVPAAMTELDREQLALRHALGLA